MPKKSAIQKGMHFGRLVALYPRRLDGRTQWQCLCVCGEKKWIDYGSLVSGATKSCGCIRKETTVGRNKERATHGRTGTRVFNIWHTMKTRCSRNCNNDNYRRYREQGIIVCDRWATSFVNFLEDMGEPPTNKHTIERIDNTGNYEPGNCRWATMKEQNMNKSNNAMITINGETKNVTQWAEHLGVSRNRIYKRLYAGMPPEAILAKDERVRGRRK